MAIRIRAARTSDVPVLADFGLALAHVHVALDPRRFVIPVGGRQAFVEFFTHELERAESVLLIAEDDDTAIGYAFVRMESASIEALLASSAWLHDVYVVPAARGHGAGRHLMAAAIDAARRLGSASLMLGVSPANAQVRAYYERLGMRSTMIEMRLDFE